MSYNETITLINYAKDLEFEYNIKLFLLIITFMYCLGSFILVSKWDNENYYAKVVKNFLIRLPFVVILFFYPLFSVYLLRGISWEWFYLLMVSYYSYSLVVLTIAGFLGLFEYALSMLRIKPKFKEMNRND